jgi:hypothetical protein
MTKNETPEKDKTPSPPPPTPTTPTMSSTGTSTGAAMAFDLQNPRDISTAYSIGASYSREQRKQLSADGKAKFIKTATGSIDDKFGIVDHQVLNDETFLEQHFDFSVQVERLRDKMNIHGMSDVFTLPVKDLQPNSPPDMTDTLDLLKTYSTWTFDKVAAWTKFVYKYADEVTIENMHLTQTLILNCCDTDLYKKVTDEISLLPLEHRGGPTTFFLMTRHIVATTAKASRAIVQRLQRVKLTSFPNEDVGRYSAVVTSISSRLESCGKLPEDIDDIVYEGLLSTTVFPLRNHLTILHTIGNPKMKTYKEMLDTATAKYNELIVENKWLPKTKAGSSFQAQGTTPPSNTNPSDDTTAPKREIDRTPPTQGEPTTRKTKDGRWNEYWCANCRDGGRWGNHSSDNHDAWVEKMKERNAARTLRKNAQQAATDPPPPVTSNPDSTAPTSEAPAAAPVTDRLRPAGRLTHTTASTLRRIGTYNSNF